MFEKSFKTAKDSDLNPVNGGTEFMVLCSVGIGICDLLC